MAIRYGKQIRKKPSLSKSYIGQCTNQVHRGYLTIEVACEHKCFDKECPYFKPDLEHPLYWNKEYSTKKIKYKRLVFIRNAARNLAKKYGRSQIT